MVVAAEAVAAEAVAAEAMAAEAVAAEVAMAVIIINRWEGLRGNSEVLESTERRGLGGGVEGAFSFMWWYCRSMSTKGPLPKTELTRCYGRPAIFQARGHYQKVFQLIATSLILELESCGCDRIENLKM